MQLEGEDGFVSLESLKGMILPARCRAHHLWAAVNRPTADQSTGNRKDRGYRQMTGEGINVNITLLFGLARYPELVEAYLDGLEACAMANRDPRQIGSQFLPQRLTRSSPHPGEKTTGRTFTEVAAGLHGSSPLPVQSGYQIYKEIFSSERYRKLANWALDPCMLWPAPAPKTGIQRRQVCRTVDRPHTINTMPLKPCRYPSMANRPTLKIRRSYLYEALPRANIGCIDATTKMRRN